MFAQGSFQSTGVPTDLAISGNGFFVMSGTQAGKSQNTYTRNGSFRFDDEGFLVSQTGNRVQGFNVDDDGTMNSLVEDIQIFPGRLLQPSATVRLRLGTLVLMIRWLVRSMSMTQNKYI